MSIQCMKITKVNLLFQNDKIIFRYPLMQHRSSFNYTYLISKKFNNQYFIKGRYEAKLRLFFCMEEVLNSVYTPFAILHLSLYLYALTLPNIGADNR